jgi:hypothetical protein
VYTRAEIAAFPPGAKAGEFDNLAQRLGLACQIGKQRAGLSGY